MSAHEQFADDLALLALGALQGDERVTLERHLAECSSCRRELKWLRGDMALLALSASGPAPPRRSRERLLKAVAKEPRAQTPPQPQGKAIYVRDRSSLIFLASNMPSLPPQKAYELWLIPTNGAPIPAGVFKPDVRGSATVIEPPLPAGVEAKAFAITVEPEQGSSTPTMPIVMMGAG